MIVRTRADFLLKFPRNISHKITVSRNLDGFSLPVAHQITGDTDLPWKLLVKSLMWRHIMQRIPWYCKFNVSSIWLKIATVSAWNFKFQISFFFIWKSLKYIHIPLRLSFAGTIGALGILSHFLLFFYLTFLLISSFYISTFCLLQSYTHTTQAFIKNNYKTLKKKKKKKQP